MKRRIFSAVAIALLVTTATLGHTPTKIEPVPQALFKEIDIPSLKPLKPSETPNLTTFTDFRKEIEVNRRNQRILPEIKPKIVKKEQNKPKIAQNKPKIVRFSGKSTSGIASWYCLSGVSRCTRSHSGGYYAAIRRDLLFLRGKTIEVCASRTNCIDVRVIDCNCGSHANLIDLYSDAFRTLAPLSRGRIKVTIRW